MNHKAAILGATAMLVLGACLGACTQSRWDKPNVTAEAASADLAACRQSAQQEAYRQTDRPFYPGFTYDRFGYGDVRWRADYEQWSANDRLYLQNRLVEYCMHTKGYQRVSTPAS